MLQALQPPKVVFQRLDRICNAFLWDKADGSKGIYWASWDKICFPTSEEGLGVRSFRDMSAVSACKLWWQLCQNRSCWAEFMQAKYIKGGHPSKVQVSRPTGIWRCLEQVRDFMESGIQWWLGKGFVDF